MTKMGGVSSLMPLREQYFSLNVSYLSLAGGVDFFKLFTCEHMKTVTPKFTPPPHWTRSGSSAVAIGHK
jgi:hypothetical protein